MPAPHTAPRLTRAQRAQLWWAGLITCTADEEGQATTEYALVLLAAALVALMVVAWATAGGGAGKVGRLFDRVIDAVIDKL